MKLYTFNPTAHQRTEKVLVGVEHDALTDDIPIVANLPKSALTCVEMTVPPYHEGEIVEYKPAVGKFIWHPLLWDRLKQGFLFTANINDLRVVLGLDSLVIDSEAVKVFKAVALHPHAVLNLWLYVFSNQPAVRFEIAVYCQSLVSPSKRIKASWDIEGGGEWVIKTYHGDSRHLIDTDMGDAQGRRWNGVIAPYDKELASDLSDPLTQTILAQLEYPLYAVTEWKQWSIFGTPPEDFSWQEAKTELDRNYWRVTAAPLEHFGYIGAKHAGQTGNQGGFGPWQSIHTQGVPTAGLLATRDWQTQQEHCRPVNYFESNGKRVKAADHPDWTTWSQTTHWHTGVSRDRLGRTHSGSQSNWSGYDYQHDYSNCARDIVLLTGSMAMQDWLKGKAEAYKAGFTLPSKKPNWSTTQLFNGRSARGYYALTQTYLATGDEELVELARQIIAQMGTWWDGYNKPNDPVRVSKHMQDPRLLQGAREAWLPYEEAKWVMAMDSWRILFEERGWPEADVCKANLMAVGESIVRHGYHPTTGHCPFALAYNGGQPITLAQWSDPTWAQIGGGGWNAWTLPAAHVIRRHAVAANNTELVGICDQRIAVASGNRDFRLYSGAK